MGKKKNLLLGNRFGQEKLDCSDYFKPIVSDTVSLYLPFALLLESSFLPFLEAILALNPCLFFLFLLDG
jgi:hypothetical protein